MEENRIDNIYGMLTEQQKKEFIFCITDIDTIYQFFVKKNMPEDQIKEQLIDFLKERYNQKKE